MPQDEEVDKTGGNLPQFRSLALVALGSNEPFDAIDVVETVKRVIPAVSAKLGVIRARSRLFRTPAYPAGSGPDFVNAAISVETSLTAPAVLEELHGIESHFGRIRTQRWGPRTLDLDLIGYDDAVLPDRETYLRWARLPLSEQMRAAPDDLILPHPRLHERAFVLVPLGDVAADWVHPVTGLSVTQMIDALPKEQRAEVNAI